MAWRIINPDGTFEDERIARWRTLVDRAMVLVVNSDDGENIEAIQRLDEQITKQEAIIRAAGLEVPGPQ
jgi:hypothetical protein